MKKFLKKNKVILILISLILSCLLAFSVVSLVYNLKDWITQIFILGATLFSGLLTMIGVIFTINEANSKELKKERDSLKMAYFLVFNELFIFFSELEEYLLIKAIKKIQNLTKEETTSKDFSKLYLNKYSYKFSNEFKNNISKIAYDINYDKKDIIRELFLLGNLNDKINMNEIFNSKDNLELEKFYRIFNEELYELINKVFLHEDSKFELLKEARNYKKKCSDFRSFDKEEVLRVDALMNKLDSEMEESIEYLNNIKQDAYKILAQVFKGKLHLSKEFDDLMNFIQSQSKE